MCACAVKNTDRPMPRLGRCRDFCGGGGGGEGEGVSQGEGTNRRDKSEGPAEGVKNWGSVKGSE